MEPTEDIRKNLAHNLSTPGFEHFLNPVATLY